MNCIGCGASQERPRGALRCPNCGDLLEITFPEFKAGRAAGLDAAGLKALWRQRRTSRADIDQSGVWRFREVLPAIAQDNAINLREGNTPLYALNSCARSAGVRDLYAKLGHESHRIV